MRYQGFLSGVMGTIAALSLSLPLQAADKILFVFDSLSVSVPVDSLERFANKGEASQQLRRFFNLVSASEEEIALFRDALSQTAAVDPVLVSRILNTEEGERILDYFGRIINIQGGRNGKFPLRGAIVTAAFEPEGLNLINVLEEFPTNIQVDLRASLELARKVELIVEATNTFVQEVEKLADSEAENSEPIDFSQLPNLRQPGSFGVKHQTWQLRDSQRNRQFSVEVYQPQEFRSGKTPVVILSHGLASRPEDFANRAKYLASYGYVVAMPQHPGSDLRQTRNFIEGYTRQIFFLDEFINRPLDISYTIDELARRNEQEFDGTLDLDNVGVFGHSFGGYSALAVAGATPDFQWLERACELEIGVLNLALLLQCRALKLERKDYNFRDERVKAVFVINPVNAGIFGERGIEQIDIPVFIAAGSYDPATPFVFEQAVTYPRLQVEDKYLQLQEGQAHVDFSQLDAGITDLIETTVSLTLPSPELLDIYTNAPMLAFFEVYIADDPSYRPFLKSSYLEYLSQGQAFKAYLITQVSAEPLNQSIQRFIKANNITTPYLTP